MKKLFAEFEKRDTKEFYLIELSYENFFHWFMKRRGNPWFCRVWRKDWLSNHYENRIKGLKSDGWAYGKNKFEAYRNAVKDLSQQSQTPTVEIEVGEPVRLTPFNDPVSAKQLEKKEYSADEMYSFVRYLMEKEFINVTPRWKYIKTLRERWEFDYKKKNIWY